jgi:hypothetical protein
MSSSIVCASKLAQRINGYWIIGRLFKARSGSSLRELIACWGKSARKAQVALVQRDGNDVFRPRLVHKQPRRLTGFKDQVISLYVRGWQQVRYHAQIKPVVFMSSSAGAPWRTVERTRLLSLTYFDQPATIDSSHGESQRTLQWDAKR